MDVLNLEKSTKLVKCFFNLRIVNKIIFLIINSFKKNFIIYILLNYIFFEEIKRNVKLICKKFKTKMIIYT
jgi:hypothetical protein